MTSPAPTPLPAPVLVIGAGLAGLTAALALHAAGRPVRVLEARDRVGGRTRAVPALPGSPAAEQLDLGATWGWSHHPHLMQLLREQHIESFLQPSAGATACETTQGVYRLPQQPAGSTGYLRFRGGAAALGAALAQQLPAESLVLNTRATHLRQLPGQQGVTVAVVRAGTRYTLTAPAVVLALPPRLAAHSFQFSPPLPPALHQTLRAVPTWMSHAMKGVAV